jgi:hypothetical protein
MIRASLLCAAALAGCQPLGGAFLAPAAEPAVVATQAPAYQVGEPAPAGVEVQVRELARGERGACLLVTVRNTMPAGTLAVDWSRLRIRLAGGQYRHAITRQQLARLTAEFSARSYGLGGSPSAAAELLPADGEVTRLAPGQERELLVCFGVPPEERGCLLLFEPALHWQRGDGEPALSFGLPLNVAVQLPKVTTEFDRPAWWPDWLHVGVVISSDM